MSNEYSPPSNIFIQVRRETLEVLVNSSPAFRDYSAAIEELKVILKNYPG